MQTECCKLKHILIMLVNFELIQQTCNQCFLVPNKYWEWNIH